MENNNLTGHDVSLVQSMYKAALDWESRNAEGMEPVMKTVEDIRGIDSIEDMNTFLCDPERSFFTDAFLYLGNMNSPTDSSRYVCYVWNDDLLLENAEEYSNRTEFGNRCLQAYLYEATSLLPRIGYTEEEAISMFENTIALEARIAENSLTSAQMAGADYDQITNNYYAPGAIRELSPEFPLAERIAGYGYGEAAGFQIPQPNVLKSINDLYTEDNLGAIKDYMIVRYVIHAAPYLDRAAYDVSVKASNLINGTVGQKSDEMAAYDVIRQNLRVPMNKAFVEYYDAANIKKQITELCKEIIGAFRVMLREEEWLSSQTKAEAIEKLNYIQINAVYPDKWVDYSSLDLQGLSYRECYEAAYLFSEAVDKSHINGEVDKDLWTVDILDAKTSYITDDNSINIFLGVLGAPLYYKGISQEEMMGKIGIVIAAV